jgi:hypothetical protein
MENPPDKANGVSPREVLRKVSAAMPEECKPYVMVIESLAAGFHFFGDREDQLVQTKDIDCLLRPRVQAVPTGRRLADQLLDSGWKYHATVEFPAPGTLETPDEMLPVVRLAPPGEESWFIELLTVPEDETDFEKRYVPMDTKHGRFSLCSLGGIGLTQWKPLPTEFGISVARPEMMALANLLHHPRIGDELMSGLIAGRSIRRSNKDLGRVLALANLAEAKQEDALLEWPKNWLDALNEFFPATWADYASACGGGVRALLASPNDLEEAHHTCQSGLVASLRLSEETLRVTGERLLVDVIEPIETMARQGLHSDVHLLSEVPEAEREKLVKDLQIDLSPHGNKVRRTGGLTAGEVEENKEQL